MLDDGHIVAEGSVQNQILDGSVSLIIPIRMKSKRQTRERTGNPDSPMPDVP